MFHTASRIVITGVMAGAMGGGCVSARDEYVDYGDRILDADTRQIDAPIVSVQPDVTGDFLWSATPANITPEKVFRLRVDLEYTPVTANTGLLDFSGIALDVDTSEEVGQPFVAIDVEVGEDGTFVAPLTGLLAARANPVTGSDAPVDAEVHGRLVTEDFLCGTLTGDAGALPLDGSTWGSVRVIGQTLPPQVLRCADQPTR